MEATFSKRSRLMMMMTAVALVLAGLAATPATAATAACDGSTVDARVSAVTLCGTLSMTGTGGDAFDLVVPTDTIVSLGACGKSPQDSFLCDLDTKGTSEIMGLVIHEPNPTGVDWAYQVFAERSQELTGGYREMTVGRGFETFLHNRQQAVIIPAGHYRVRLLGDETTQQLRWRTEATGSAEVVPKPDAVDWRAVEPSYGNSTAGGAGENFEVDGPTLAVFAYGWLPDRYVTEAQFGICAYENPVTINETSWAPGCPDRVTGDNDAFELTFGVGFGGPFGQGFAITYAGDTEAFGWGGYHASLGAGGTQTAVALELALD